MDFPSDAELMDGPNALEDAGQIIPAQWPEDYRAGFVCLVGRPNAGKSTLTNALVGQKIAITSQRPQTTRHVVRGVVHREHGQLVLVDTPGLHRPRTLLGKRLNTEVRESLTSVDLIVFCLPANEQIGPGDRYIAAELANTRTPLIAAVTKIDLVNRDQLVEKLLQVQELAEFQEIVPVSAVKNEQTELLESLLMSKMPLSPPLYPPGELTDESETVMIGELIREAALEGVTQELPHSLAVVVEEIVPRQRTAEMKPMLDIYADIYVERDSQKAIVIGKGGTRLREVGTRARKEIEALLGARVYLNLHVRTAKDWQRDPKLLKRLGF